MSPLNEINNINRAYGMLRALLKLLPLEDIPPWERSRLAGQLFSRAPELTAEVTLALRRSPDSFPEARGEADAIEQDMRKGAAWIALSNLLRVSAGITMNQGLSCQGRAVERCRKVLRTVSGGAKHPELSPHLSHRLRLELMEAPLRIAYEAFMPRVKKRLASQLAKKDPAAAAPAKAPRPRPTQGRRAAAFQALLQQLTGP